MQNLKLIYLFEETRLNSYVVCASFEILHNKKVLLFGKTIRQDIPP